MIKSILAALLSFSMMVLNAESKDMAQIHWLCAKTAVSDVEGNPQVLAVRFVTHAPEPPTGYSDRARRSGVVEQDTKRHNFGLSINNADSDNNKSQQDNTDHSSGSNIVECHVRLMSKGRVVTKFYRVNKGATLEAFKIHKSMPQDSQTSPGTRSNPPASELPSQPPDQPPDSAILDLQVPLNHINTPTETTSAPQVIGEPLDMDKIDQQDNVMNDNNQNAQADTEQYQSFYFDD